WSRDSYRLLDPGHGLDRLEAGSHVANPDNSNDYALLAFNGMHLVAELSHTLANGLYILAIRVHFHRNNHESNSNLDSLAPEPEKPTRFRVGCFDSGLPFSERPSAASSCA